ncbi:MAG: hypothetical protein HYS40_02460 [Gemmatimonadetes bacterium]|nr:hypothetical protein [Gemmatimonadota bacterium]
MAARSGFACLVVAVTLLAAPRWRPAAGQEAAPARGPRLRPWVRPVASLVVPGAGQLLAGEDRGAAYVAAELYVVSRYLQLNREGGREAGRFRALAFDVARRAFTGVRRDTVFEYYETMERFTESGAFDSDPGADFIPESDPATYNGSVWLLARRTFWTDPNVPPSPTSPEYQRALQFYRDRAVGADYLWSWRNASLEQQAFRDAIRRSDNAFRRSQTQLGLLLANHVLSAVDAIISSRVAAAVRRPAAVRTAVGPGRSRVAVHLSF